MTDAYKFLIKYCHRWRGYNSRKTKFDYYLRKKYLSDLAIKVSNESLFSIFNSLGIDAIDEKVSSATKK